MQMEYSVKREELVDKLAAQGEKDLARAERGDDPKDAGGAGEEDDGADESLRGLLIMLEGQVRASVAWLCLPIRPADRVASLSISIQ